jgi:hypothetical protein
MFYEFLGKLFQIVANANHEERVRKRGRVVADAAVAAAGGQPDPSNAAAADVALQNDEAAAEGQAPVASAPAPNAPAAGRSIVRDAPDRWGDAHVAWRHSCLFAFALYGPLTYFHPDIGSRTVCEFLRKVPRSGPPNAGAAARHVDEGDSRRQQRRHNERDAGISRAESDNRNFIEEIAQSRLAQERAARESNELARLQLQVQLAGMQQRQQPSRFEHVEGLRKAIELLNKKPEGIVLSADQILQKQDMERRYADAVLALGQVQEDPFASLSSAIANATQPFHAPPPVFDDAIATVPRSNLRGASASNQLHPNYLGRVSSMQGRGAEADNVDSASNDNLSNLRA